MKCPVLALILLVSAAMAFAQTESARIAGRVTDLSGAVIVGAECKITNLETNVSTAVPTNEDGIYVIPDLHPATYRLTVQKEGFRTVVHPSFQLYVQDAVNENFTLAIGPASEIVTVGASLLQTDSASVSTVVDDQFVQNMPLNGRSFQPLIALAPGVVFTSQNLGDGQFSVNGQRSDANYFMVDGVSANFGVTISGLGETLAGAIPGFTAQGGTNGLVSVDAMQEFRIQTSSYAPEFGRVPGAQISIVTKSGTNHFHGTAFDYLRNDIFDARNYFDAPPLIKPPLRQNDFGGVLGGPILKDKTFFFFSYEGLRLWQPQTASGEFLTASARAAVAPDYQPLLNALPLPDPNSPLVDPTCDNITNPCLAMLNAAYSIPSSLNATSIRVDHYLNSKIILFARYNHAPSYNTTRRWEELAYDNANTNTFTAGATILIAPTKVNDFRANWSRNTILSSHPLRISMVGFRRLSRLCSRPHPLTALITVRPFSISDRSAMATWISEKVPNTTTSSGSSISWTHSPGLSACTSSSSESIIVICAPHPGKAPDTAFFPLGTRSWWQEPSARLISLLTISFP